ncbi:MAG: DUF3109 family protein [Candidatus Wallbacteria bacterium]|nr:DUF3109 family protein [Candidatus Wallbacteria bacterium]
MIEVGDILVSEDAVTARFACDLGACLGACCRVGDAGAPLGPGEREAVEEALAVVLAWLPAENRELFAREGFVDRRQPEKPQLVCFPDGRCVFSIAFAAASGRTGVPLGCALEAAFRRGLTRFRKPLFCHLFPLKLGHFYDRRVLNVERRPECEPGFDGGIGMLESSREVLVRLFGDAWYEQCLEAARRERERLKPSR